jgi:hypothetical protein
MDTVKAREFMRLEKNFNHQGHEGHKGKKNSLMKTFVPFGQCGLNVTYHSMIEYLFQEFLTATSKKFLPETHAVPCYILKFAGFGIKTGQFHTVFSSLLRLFRPCGSNFFKLW